jgi:thiamine-monophosphate kinase
LNLENYFISLFKNKYIGDDAAFIDSFVYSKDAFFENIHFKTQWINYYEIAKKSMLVNISDAIAMNAKPLYALLSVAMPKTMSKTEMRNLADGFKDVANMYGIEIIGGDTISNIKLDITITIISKTKKPLTRVGLRSNHLLAYTGKLGDSSKDLRKLLNGGTIHKKSKFINIKLRDKFINKSSKYLSSGMDISDGLFSDLSKLLFVNNLGLKFYKKISKQIGCSGEEYEMLISFDKRHKKTLLRIANKTRTNLTIFAQSTRGKYINKCKAHHF